MTSKIKDPIALAYKIADLLAQNYKAEESGKTKENYIVATVTELTNGAKPDQKKHHDALIKLDGTARRMMIRKKPTQNSKDAKFTAADGVIIMLQLAESQEMWGLGEETTTWLPWPFGPSTPPAAPVPTPISPCKRKEIFLNGLQGAYNDAVSDLQKCRGGLSGSPSGPAPSPLFVDNPSGDADPTPGGGGTSAASCSSEESRVDFLYDEIERAANDYVINCA